MTILTCLFYDISVTDGRTDRQIYCIYTIFIIFFGQNFGLGLSNDNKNFLNKTIFIRREKKITIRGERDRERERE